MHALGMTSAPTRPCTSRSSPCAPRSSRACSAGSGSRRQYAGIALLIAGALIVTVGSTTARSRPRRRAARCSATRSCSCGWSPPRTRSCSSAPCCGARGSVAHALRSCSASRRCCSLVTVPGSRPRAAPARSRCVRRRARRGPYCVAYYVLVNWGDAYMVSLSLPPSTVALGLTLEPLFTALLEWACFHDVMTLGQVAGAACTCLGSSSSSPISAHPAPTIRAGGSRTPRPTLPGTCEPRTRPNPSAEAARPRSLHHRPSVSAPKWDRPLRGGRDVVPRRLPIPLNSPPPRPAGEWRRAARDDRGTAANSRSGPLRGRA